MEQSDKNRQSAQDSGIRWIWIIGLCAGLEALNLEWLPEGAPKGLSAAITIILIAAACYGGGMLYKLARANALANLAEHHDKLAGGLDALHEKLLAMERQMAEDRERQAAAAEAGQRELARHAASLAEQIDQGRLEAHQAGQATAAAVDKLASGIERNGQQLESLVKAESENAGAMIRSLRQTATESAEALKAQIAASAEQAIGRTNAKLDDTRNGIVTRLDDSRAAVAAQLDQTSEQLQIALDGNCGATLAAVAESAAALAAQANASQQAIAGKLAACTDAVGENGRQLIRIVQAESASLAASIEVMRSASADAAEALELRFTQAVAALQQEAMDKLVHHVAMRDTALHASLEQRNRTVDDKFGHINKQISVLSATVGDKTDDLRASLARTLAIATDIESSGRSNYEHVAKLIAQAMELDRQWAEGSKHVLAKQEETGQRIAHLETQLSALLALVSMLRAVSADALERQASGQQPDKDRIETVRDDANGLLLVNTYRDNVLRESEMHRHGNKIYTAVYDETGAMTASHNFDSSGELATELLYYSNGAVKERRETAKENGRKVTKTTRFTEQGIRK